MKGDKYKCQGLQPEDSARNNKKDDCTEIYADSSALRTLAEPPNISTI